MYQMASKDQTKAQKPSTPSMSWDQCEQDAFPTRSIYSPTIQTRLQQDSVNYAPTLQMRQTDRTGEPSPRLSKQPNATGIPAQMKETFESLSGFSFDDVRVHYNSEKPAQLQALAYTQGNQVYVAPGQEHHLGHELGHVIQQKQGRVKPTGQINGLSVNDAQDLEREADHPFLSQGGFSPEARAGEHVVQRYKKITGTRTLKQNKADAAAQTLYGELYNDIKNTVLDGKAEGKLGTDENASTLMPVVVPDTSVIGLSKNSDPDINSQAPGYAQGVIAETIEKPETRARYYTFLDDTLGRLDDGATELAGDIDYWKEELEENPENYTNMTASEELTDIEVDAVKLTGSDIHDRGLGVAFVTFSATSQGRNVAFELVLKPDRRDLEESLLSDAPTSLANQFNEYTWIYNGEDISESQKIMPIPMKVSPPENAHGTIIKKLVGQQIRNLTQSGGIPNLHASIKAIVFACFAGISDLHRENVLYGKVNDETVPYLIDSDVALSKEVLLDDKKTRGQDGFSHPALPAEIRITDFSRTILVDVKRAFAGKTCRIVPLDTAYFQSQRASYVFARKEDHRYDILNEHIPKLYDSLNKSVGLQMLDWEIECEQVIADFSQGQIPLYTYDYNNGVILHNGRVIGQCKNIDDMFHDALAEMHAR